jgi:hypothetical protein
MSALTSPKPLPDLAIRTLDDDALDTTLLGLAAGRNILIGTRLK